jgi:membrane fusion protein (multidrug efflux system)
MRMPALILTVTAATLLVAPAHPQEKAVPSRKDQADESARKVKDLRKERVKVLQELTDQLERLFQRAQVPYDEVINARTQLFQAELEAAETEAQRVALYKKLVDVLKQSESLAENRLKAARGTMTAVLKVRARRLEAEIHLAQAKARKPALGPHKIVVTTPRAKDVVITQAYVCRIHSQHHINVRALQKGYLQEVMVREGQAVKKDEVMFKVLPVLYQAKLDVELAEARLAELELRDAKRRFKDKVISQNEVARFEAKLARAKARARVAEVELRFTEVRAPFDGVVGRLNEQQGSLITERDTLTTLSDNRVMWAYFNVPEARYLEYVAGRGKEKEGKIAFVLATGKKFNQTGKIGAIEAQFNNETGNIPFRADFPNPDGLLRHGMTGKVLIHRPLKNAIVIPQRATFEVLGKRYVYVVDKNDVVHRRRINVQNELDDVFVINRGLGVDDRIIVEGARPVRDGEKVKYEFRPPGPSPGTPPNHPE